MNIEQLKAQVEAKRKENAARIGEAMEVMILKGILARESSETLFKAKVNLAVKDTQTAKLQQMVDECAAIVASVPVFNSKTRTNRVWAGSHKYSYGTQIDLMYQLATGILYACAEHKQLLLAHTGLELELLEQMVKAFGQPTYYSRNYHTIVEAKPFTLEAVKDTVEIMQSRLDVIVDTTELTFDNFEMEFVRAESNAAKALKQAEEAIAEADLSL